MNRQWGMIAPWLMILIISGCVRLKVELPPDPEVVVEYMAVKKSVHGIDDFTLKLTDDRIRVSDPKVYVIAKVNDVGDPKQIQWKWFGPDGEIARRSDPQGVNQEAGYLSYFIAWDSMDNESFRKKPGKWTVVVTVDSHYLTRKTFAIGNGS